MTKPIIKIVNAETGEEIEREMNKDEFAQYQIDLVESEKLKKAEVDRKSARNAVLEKLGLTAEEAAAILQ